MHFSYSFKAVIAGILVYSVYSFFLPSCTFSQSAQVSAKEQVELWFDNETGKEHSGLISGIRNWDYNHHAIGHQYFKERRWLIGEMTYQGEHYTDIRFKYDVNKDIVILRHFDDNQREVLLELKSQLISKFSLLGHNFRRLEMSDNGENLKTGFYEIMYEGSNVQLISKRFKSVDDNLEDRIVRLEFKEDDRFYIRQGNKYYQVKRAKDFYKAFKPYKKEIKSYLKRNSIRKRNNDEWIFIDLATFCNELPNPKL